MRQEDLNSMMISWEEAHARRLHRMPTYCPRCMLPRQGARPVICDGCEHDGDRVHLIGSLALSWYRRRRSVFDLGILRMAALAVANARRAS